MQTLRVVQLVGRTVGEYQIEQLLGQGQLGTAYLARQRSQGRTVVMTLFNFPENISTQERDQITTLLDQERATLVRLTHPTILPVYDLGEHAGSLYLVTAFVKGTSLGQVLKQRGRFTPQQTLGVLKQVAAGLDYAHSQGVVHGILSLSHVLIGDELTLQLTGFGLRTLLEIHTNTQNRQPQAHLLSRSGIFLGSPASLSPERVLGQPVDAGSDLYALGVMLFELLSGTPPFRGATLLDMALERIQQPVPSVHAVCPDVPEALDLVISKTLERDPAKRYQRAGESAAAFERVLTLLEATRRATDFLSNGVDHALYLLCKWLHKLLFGLRKRQFSSGFPSRTQQVAQGSQTPPPAVNWYEEAGMPTEQGPQTPPPMVNWYEEAGMPTEQGQLLPPMMTGHLPVGMPSSSSESTLEQVIQGDETIEGDTTLDDLNKVRELVLNHPKVRAFMSKEGSRGLRLVGTRRRHRR